MLPKALLMIISLVAVWPSPARADLEEMFTGIYNQVDQYLQLNEQLRGAEEEHWYPQPFTDTKTSVKSDIDQLLDEVLTALLDDRLVTLKDEINQRLRRNLKLEEELADLQFQLLAAPKDKKFFEIWKDDQRGLEEKSAQARLELETNRARIEENKKAIGRLLAEAGLSLSEAEIDSLINTVTGDDTLKVMAALKNVQAILKRLGELMSRENENIHLAQKYYGLFLLLTEAYARQLDLFISQVAEKYLPKLEIIQKENAGLMEKTRGLAVDNPKYGGNLKAQEITEEAAARYAEVLAAQKQRIMERRTEVEGILAFAENTYLTVKLAHNLYLAMNEGLNAYDSLMSLELVEVIPFENRELEAKFLELTHRLAE